MSHCRGAAAEMGSCCISQGELVANVALLSSWHAREERLNQIALKDAAHVY